LGSAGLPAQPQALGASVTPKQELFVKDNRPVNLDIGTIKLPITAFASISHRITGVILVLASFLMLWALEASLSGPESFAALAESLSSPLAKLVAWGIGSALLYHSLAGVRHLIMDFGVGESLEGGVLGARIVFALTAVGALILGVALW
jgi:succinate dehydrogenase / fumarate reductase cytochrome b subunit